MGRGNESLCFLSGSEKNSGCYGNLKFPLTCMEKSGNWHFPLSGWGYLNFVLHKCLLSSPSRATFVKITLFVWLL